MSCWRVALGDRRRRSLDLEDRLCGADHALRSRSMEPTSTMTSSVAPSARGENPLVEGLERLPVHPTALVIFGATGDLGHRKLLPALYNLAHEGSLPEHFELIGVARPDQPHEDFRRIAREAVAQ